MTDIDDGYDVTVENGWRCGPDCSHPIIGVVAETERGEAFLTAYCDETSETPGADDDVIGSASLLPEDLAGFKRMAIAAGVRLDTRRFRAA
jgi:hypothetical protein